jgi:hypothetical protein
MHTRYWLAPAALSLLAPLAASANPNGHYAVVEPIHVNCGGEGGCEHVGDRVTVYADTSLDAGLEGGVYIGRTINRRHDTAWDGSNWRTFGSDYSDVPSVTGWHILPNGKRGFVVMDGSYKLCEMGVTSVQIAVGYGAVQPDKIPNIKRHERLKHEHSILSDRDLKFSYAYHDLFGAGVPNAHKWRQVVNETCFIDGPG